MQFSGCIQILAHALFNKLIREERQKNVKRKLVSRARLLIPVQNEVFIHGYFNRFTHYNLHALSFDYFTKLARHEPQNRLVIITLNHLEERS